MTLITYYGSGIAGSAPKIENISGIGQHRKKRGKFLVGTRASDLVGVLLPLRAVDSQGFFVATH